MIDQETWDDFLQAVLRSGQDGGQSGVLRFRPPFHQWTVREVREHLQQEIEGRQRVVAVQHNELTRLHNHLALLSALQANGLLPKE